MKKLYFALYIFWMLDTYPMEADYSEQDSMFHHIKLWENTECCNSTPVKAHATKPKRSQSSIAKKSKPDNTTQFSCCYCKSFISPYMAKMKAHIIFDHLMQTEDVDMLIPQCINCEYQTWYRANMASHIMRMHTYEKTFKCTLCCKWFYTKRDVRNHRCVQSYKKRSST